MVEEKIFKDEILSDEELDIVVGGNSIQGEYLDMMVGTIYENGLGKYIVPGENNMETIINTFRKYGIGVDVRFVGNGIDGRVHQISFCFGGEWYELDYLAEGDADVDWLSYFKKAVAGQ